MPLKSSEVCQERTGQSNPAGLNMRSTVWLSVLVVLWVTAISGVRWHCGSWPGVLQALRGKAFRADIVKVERAGEDVVAVTVALRNLLLKTITIYGAGTG